MYLFHGNLFQDAPSKDKLEKNVLHTLIVIKPATPVNLQSALQFVLLVDVSVPMERL